MSKTQDELNKLYQQITGSKLPSSMTSMPSQASSTPSSATEMASTVTVSDNGVTTADLAQATNAINDHIDGQLGQQTTTLTSSVQQLINEAYNKGRNQTYIDLQQQLDGQQSRIDRMTADKTEADKMASADHATLHQIKQHFAKTMKVINQNTNTETALVEQLQQPIEIDGHDLLKAIEEENGSTIRQMISSQVTEYINGSVDSIEQNRQAIADWNQHLMDQLKMISNWLSIMIPTLLATMVVPWWTAKLIIAGVGMIGGISYGYAKKKLD